MKYQYLREHETIKRSVAFGAISKRSTISPLHIAYGIDRNFLFGCGVSIASVLINNSEMDFVFHVFIDEIFEEDEKQFILLAEQYKTKIEVHIVNGEKLNTLPITKNWSVAMYFRFIIGDYFIGREDRVLYLDADIVCKGSIGDLCTIDFSGNVAAVVYERDKHWWDIRAKSLSCEPLTKGYFNSGFLLLNIPAWFHEHVSRKALEMLSDSRLISKLTFMDQDILNIILANKVKIIDKKYNTQFSLNYELKDHVINPISDETIFIHYVGPTKPWHNWAQYPSAEPFHTAKLNSPWKEWPLVPPINSNYARYCAKHNYKQKKYFSWFKNYIIYFYLKITKSLEK